MANALLSIVLEGLEHAHKIEVIIEAKVASEAKAIANAVTPDLETAIRNMTAKLASIRALHETPVANAAGATGPSSGPTGATGAAVPIY